MDLSQIFDQGQFSLIKPGMDAFNLEQQKQQAGLAGLLGQEQRAQEMQPYEIASKKAYAGQAQAQADTMQDHLKVLQGIPMDQRIAVGVAENKSKLTGAALQQADTEMEQLAKLAAAAVQNGGTLPLGMNVSNPEHAKYFSTPQGAKLAAQITSAYFNADPKQQAAESKSQRDYQRQLDVAKQMTAWHEQKIVADAAKGSGGNGEPPKMSTDQAISYWRNKAMSEPDAAKKKQMEAMADQAELTLLNRRQLEIQARQANDPDLAGRGIPTVGAPQVKPTPKPGETPDNSETKKMTLSQLKSLYPGIPDDVLKAKFKSKFGIDVNE